MILPRVLEGLVSCLPDVIVMVNGRLAESDRRNGCYLCVYRVRDNLSETSTPALILRIGNGMTDEKARRYFDRCQEKARRLLLNPSHISGWQTRDPDKDQWGGAVRLPDAIVAMSGLIEKADEAVLVNAAVSLGMMQEVEAVEIAAISDNELINLPPGLS